MLVHEGALYDAIKYAQKGCAMQFIVRNHLNNALNYSQKFYTDKSDNNDFILHDVGTGPVGKIHVGNSGNIKFLKNSYQPDINSIKDSKRNS